MTEVPSRTGDYPIERRAGEIERLALQSAALAAETALLLDRIGVAPGWHCLDLACGPRGITDILSARVSPGGRVVGLDFDPAFIEAARADAPPLTEYVTGDAYATELPEQSFDLVHLRFIACTAGQPERLIAEARRLARPGGYVALEEADLSTLNCYPPHAAWTALRAALAASFPGDDAEPTAHQLFRLLRRAGLVGVEYRPVLLGVRSGDPWQDYLPATVESVRGTVIGRGPVGADALDALLADCRAHLDDPETVFTSYTVVQAWGRVPPEA
jgi:ubiquinone/menaquinone biosynthesis C-methylase UbiE